MKGSKFLLSAVAAKLVAAYTQCIAEYRQVMPLATGISNDAPDTFEKLKAEAAKGRLVVTTEFSDTAIYGISGNVTFRVFHDYGHLLYNKEFTTADEMDLAATQWRDLVKYIEPEWQGICRVVYFADTYEQSFFESIHGKFPEDQRRFVLGHLNAWLDGLVELN